MRGIGGGSAVASFSDRGGTLATGSSVGLRPWRVLALLVGAALACVATLALSTLSAPMAPSARPAASRDRARGQQLVGISLGLAATASATIGATDHSF